MPLRVAPELHSDRIAPMNVGFYHSVSALRSLQQQQEVVAANLARQGVGGHREALSAVVAKAPAAQRAQFQRNGDSQPVPPPLRFDLETANRFTQGSLERTGSPLHIAIQGEAFLQVRLPDGSSAVTRNGAFARRQDGTLATPEGALLLGEGGEPVAIGAVEEFGVGPDGMMTVAGAQIGRVGLVRIADPGKSLEELRPGFFTPKAGVTPEPGPGTSDVVVQGALEQSNAQPVEQMVALTSVLRAYEASQRAIAAQDEATGRLIRAAGPSGI